MSSIILVDDDKEFVKSFTNEAFANGINVSGHNSLEGLKKVLPTLAHKYAAVVLDIKCLLTDDQVKEDASFITTAITYLDSTIAGFPRFILTGDESEFNTLKKYYKDEKMFIKKPEDQGKLLGELISCVKNAEPLRIRRENPEIFEAFKNGLLPMNKEQKVINILKKYNEKDPANFKGIIGDIREIHEEIYKSINNRNNAVVPPKFINANGLPTFTSEFYKHLIGNPDIKYVPTTLVYQDSTISNLTKFIHASSSEFIHGTSKIKYVISPYTLKSLINGLMEIIIWSKQF